MNEVGKRALAGLARFVVVLALIQFFAAGTLDYWQAWVFLAVFSACCLAITLHLLKHDPKLVERRMKSGPGAEKEPSQKIIMVAATMSIAVLFVFPPIDYRFGWSMMPSFMVAVGDFLVALGMLFVFFVFKENSFAAATIAVHDGQKVVSTGPYGLVRHPMYAGALVMMLGVPLALGSWWGLQALVPFTLVLAWRLLDEEKFLIRNLPGYAEYRNQVRYRLVPFIW